MSGKMRRIAWVLIAAPLLFGRCAFNRAAVVPLPTMAQALRPGGPASNLIVFLPGRRSHLGDFESNRFFDMSRERGIDADLVETDLHLGYYTDGTYATRLWEDVVSPARDAGSTRIWLVGISLGGAGAIGFAREHPDAIAGLILLSPFLGPPEMLEGIRSQGGLATWSPDPTAAPGSLKWFIEQNWDFLRHAGEGSRPPILYLGYGQDEPMVPSLDLLAGTLPADRVIRVPGGHRWNTWRTLWAEILSRLGSEPRRGD
ncbi:MAG TPA: alpha/beta hydrolase [Verrucomicrobiae bacterium]|nr:alpha/beta hydrolase [Verrucomicrobiae bacterium]